MQIKIAPGSAGTAIGIIGTGLAMLLPEQRWIGILLIGIGLLVFLFDIRVERGHVESGGHRLGKFLLLSLYDAKYRAIALVVVGVCAIVLLTREFWPLVTKIIPSRITFTYHFPSHI
jgi:hypothetical protein